jgi:hypothetical protein
MEDPLASVERKLTVLIAMTGFLLGMTFVMAIVVFVRVH